MAHVVVLGAGLGGAIMAYELKDQLRPEDKVTVVTKDPTYHFVPSNPWIAVGWRDREDITVDLAPVMAKKGIGFIPVAAEKLGLSADDPDDSPHRDLDEARRLITALAGLVTASAEYLGPHAGPVRDGLKSLQLAFREASVAPDEPGQGPGEKYTGPVW